MANLTGIGIDSNVEEANGEFTVLPAGTYKACIVGDELKDNKAGTGKVLLLKLQIIDGQFAGTVIKDYLNITNPNQTTQIIGQGTLKRICNICSVQFPPNDTAGLMGKPMSVKVRVEEFTSDRTGKKLNSNKITNYDKFEQVPTQSQPQTQNPQQGVSAW